MPLLGHLDSLPRSVELVSEGKKEPLKNVKEGGSDSSTYQLCGSRRVISPL